MNRPDHRPGAAAAGALRLIGRSSSHYTRIVRMLAHELDLPLELEVVHDLTRLDAAHYGGNPALRVPVLRVGGSALWGTEHICRHLVERAGRIGDPRIVLTEQLRDERLRNAQELVWHAMAAQVQLRVGLAVNQLPADNPFFVKIRTGLAAALAWLDARLDDALGRLPTPRDVSLLEVSLYCLIEHLAFLPTVALDPYPRLRGFARDYGVRDSARRTPLHFDPRPHARQEAS
ncbi:glutathione S-transferase N-terminal domain-containing protein [Fontimonas sp. SYSU GA230001]|uniref:glutathione S-transferase N-terminal domain-containing protein n=1 Tax=Fontimonas sp. SYSU GA230001 TaxID=3142450 RepID=UPI0032B44129